MELKALGDDAVDAILVHLADDVHDLLHFSRTCKRFNQAVKSSLAAWEQAFTATFGPAAPNSSSDGTPWLDRYKTRFLREAHTRRLVLAARSLKASSTVQVLRQEVHRLNETLDAEVNALERSTNDLAALQEARRSQEAADAPHATYWLPMAVARAQGVRTVLLPRNREERERELQQAVAVTSLEVKKAINMLAAKKQKLAAAEAKLQALQP